MARLFPLVLMLVLTATGCSRSGDFGEFVTTEVERLGGRTLTNAPASRLSAKWKAERDENGFYANVTGASFAELNNAMTHLFGPPFQSVETNATGMVSSFWNAEQTGVAIQFNQHPNHAEVISVRVLGGSADAAASAGE